jgi:hypothetical protein
VNGRRLAIIVSAAWAALAYRHAMEGDWLGVLILAGVSGYFLREGLKRPPAA